MDNNQQRIYSLDIAKALCIVLVVVGHFNPDNAPAWWKCINQIIYSFHMPLFLFVSGYVYRHTLRKQSYSTFMEKKCRRLAVPYLITSAIIISIKLLSASNYYRTAMRKPHRPSHHSLSWKCCICQWLDISCGLYGHCC